MLDVGPYYIVAGEPARTDRLAAVGPAASVGSGGSRAARGPGEPFPVLVPTTVVATSVRLGRDRRASSPSFDVPGPWRRTSRSTAPTGSLPSATRTSSTAVRRRGSATTTGPTPARVRWDRGPRDRPGGHDRLDPDRAARRGPPGPWRSTARRPVRPREAAATRRPVRSSPPASDRAPRPGPDPSSGRPRQGSMGTYVRRGPIGVRRGGGRRPQADAATRPW